MVEKRQIMRANKVKHMLFVVVVVVNSRTRKNKGKLTSK